MSKAFNAAFQRLVQRALPRPVGSRLQMARYNTFNAACSVGKWPRALTALRSRALRLSIAFVEQMIRRISTSNARNGTISAQALVPNRMMAGDLRSHLGGNSA